MRSRSRRGRSTPVRSAAQFLLAATAGFAVGATLFTAAALADINCGGGNCFGNAGNNTIIGSNGADDIFAGDGDDTVYANGGRDDVNGGDGWDNIAAGGSIDSVSANSGEDQIYSGDGSCEAGGCENLFGEGGDDYAEINGNSRGTITGNGGRDRLSTQKNERGDDSANGGDGIDTCFTDPADSRRDCEQGGDV